MSTPRTRAGPARLSYLLPVRASSVRRARSLLGEYARKAGADPATAHRVRLAVSEAVSNVVQHAYDDEPVRTIEIGAWVLPDELWILIGDRGCGLKDDHSEATGLGLGMAIIAACAEEPTFAVRADGGTEVRMRFTLGSKRGTTAGPSADGRSGAGGRGGDLSPQAHDRARVPVARGSVPA